jgi:hypothetical protein
MTEVVALLTVITLSEDVYPAFILAGIDVHIWKTGLVLQV